MIYYLPSCLLKNGLDASFSIVESSDFSFWRATAMINILLKQTETTQFNFLNTRQRWFKVYEYTQTVLEGALNVLVSSTSLFTAHSRTI